ncbi:hypothetical protein D3C73_716990 [compost metagenome]
MAYGTGVEPVAHAGSGRADVFVTGEVPRLDAEVTAVVGHRNGVPQEIMVTFACPYGAVEHDRIADIEFTGHRTKGVIGAGLAPGLRIVVAHIVGTRDLRIGTDLHPLLRRIGITLGTADVGRQSQALTAKIQAQHGHFAIDILAVPFGVTRLFHAIETQAELVVLAEAPTDIHGATDLAVGRIVAGERRDGRVSRTLGLDVDPSPHCAARRDAIDELAWAFDDVDAIGHFHVDRIRRQHAIKTVIGNIAVEQAEAANGELLVTPARRVGGAH